MVGVNGWVSWGVGRSRRGPTGPGGYAVLLGGGDGAVTRGLWLRPVYLIGGPTIWRFNALTLWNQSRDGRTGSPKHPRSSDFVEVLLISREWTYKCSAATPIQLNMADTRQWADIHPDPASDYMLEGVCR